MGLTVDSSERTFLPSSKSRNTETKTNRLSKIRPDQIQILRPSLRIHGQLPAPIVNGVRDSCWIRQNFQIWRARDLDLGWGHTAYRHASLIDLYLHAKFHWNWRNFLWMDTDVRMYVHMDGLTDRHLRPALLGKLCQPKNQVAQKKRPG